MADIVGIEGLSVDEVRSRVALGGRFVIYTWALSLLVVTLRRPSAIHFVQPGESAALKGLPYTILSFFVGWWGFPWGLIYTPMAIATNLGGGRDVTAEVMRTFGDHAPPVAYSPPASSASPGTAFAPQAPANSEQAAAATDARASLWLALTGVLCFPLGWVGAFFGFRAMTRAKAAGAPTPPLAFVGIGLGVLTSMCFAGTMVLGALAPKVPPAAPAPVARAAIDDDEADDVSSPLVQPGADDSGPHLTLRITKVYPQHQPTKKPPYHAPKGEWTFADAEGDDGLLLTFGVHAPPPSGDAPFSFGDVQLSVPDAAHGAAFVTAFDVQFGGQPGAAKPGKGGPLQMRAAILGQHQVRAGGGGGFRNGKNGDWTATKLFPEAGDHQGEVFFNFSLDDKVVEFTEKDSEYADDLSFVFTTAFAGKKLPR